MKVTCIQGVSPCVWDGGNPMKRLVVMMIALLLTAGVMVFGSIEAKVTADGDDTGPYIGAVSIQSELML